jgi:hypothetical protein
MSHAHCSSGTHGRDAGILPHKLYRIDEKRPRQLMAVASHTKFRRPRHPDQPGRRGAKRRGDPTATLSTFEQRIAERLPSYRSGPPAHRLIADERGRSTADLSAIFAALAITSATPALPIGAASTPPAAHQEQIIRREAKNV